MLYIWIIGAWPSLVGRSVRVAEVVGSNPVAPIKKDCLFTDSLSFFILLRSDHKFPWGIFYTSRSFLH